jgi:hypothetical protein
MLRLHHVVLWQTSDDLAFPEQLVALLKDDFAVQLHAYCFLPDRWRLVLEGQAPRAVHGFVSVLTRLCAADGDLPRAEVTPFAAAERLAVMRSVERFALTSGLCVAAEHWQHGSLYHRVFGTSIARRVLDPTPLPRDWVHTVNAENTGPARPEGLSTGSPLFF